MESINSNIYRFDKNDITINVLEFQIWADTNFWDSNILNENRNLYFDLIITSTDLYNNLDMKCYWFYDDSDFSLNELETKFNNSDFLYDINQCNFNNKQSYLNISNNNTIYSQNTYNQNYGVTWNDTKNVYMYIYYNDTDYDLYIDNASLNLTNNSNTPFYNEIGQTNYIDGYNNGYQNGLNANQEDIYNTGYQNGYEQGYKDTYNQAYNDGVNQNRTKIYQQGYEQGYQVGNTYGYEQGYQEGIQDNDNNLLSHAMITATDTPIRIFKQAFDFDILGVNVARYKFWICSIIINNIHYKEVIII